MALVVAAQPDEVIPNDDVNKEHSDVAARVPGEDEQTIPAHATCRSIPPAAAIRLATVNAIGADPEAHGDEQEPEEPNQEEENDSDDDEVVVYHVNPAPRGVAEEDDSDDDEVEFIRCIPGRIVDVGIATS